MSTEIICGDARDVLRGLPERSVHCVVTSPPYYSLRDYGLEPVMWGGDDGCLHSWGRETKSHQRLRNGAEGGLHEGRRTNTLPVDTNIRTGAFCRRCAGWRGSLGLEPTPQPYAEAIS